MGERLGSRPPRAVLDIVAAVVTAILAFGAVPVVLITTVGDPVTGGLGHPWPSLLRDLMCVLVLAAWLAWAACCAQLVRAIADHVRHGTTTGRRTPSLLDPVAARIAAGLLAMASLGAPLVPTATSGASVPQDHAGDAPTRPAKGGPAGSGLVRPATSYDVRPGDSLWTIAADLLDDGAAWTALAALNLDRPMSPRERFVDPARVEVGWRLRLPDGAGAEARHPEHRRGRRGTGSPAATTPGPLLPELVALGLGSLTCAALARKATRRRLLASLDGCPAAEPDRAEAVVDLESLLQRFAGVPALEAFEAANRALARALRGHPVPPIVRAACVSAVGVTFRLAEPQIAAPEGFVSVDGGAGWHVDHTILDADEPSQPYVPLALPVGEDDEGTWVLTVGPGVVLPVLGESAASLHRAFGVAVRAWAWSETIEVSRDPRHPGLRPDPGEDPAVGPHRLFLGDPRSLTPHTRSRVAVVTTAPVSATDVTVFVDRRGATLHPLGRVVRPQLLSEEKAGAIGELLGDEKAPDARSVTFVAPELRSSDDASPGAGVTNDQDPLGPGRVEVRLLTATPRLEGLREQLPPNRARRAIELVAYLALHQPAAVSGERLRTRVLGSADADAAAKTLVNTAYAARRAMGVDEAGRPLFPAGSRTGLYQVSPLVTVDVQRAVVLAAAAKHQEEPELAIAYCRAALALVESEPLANVLSGYSWWEAEGHGGRVGAALVDVACTMAGLAGRAALFDLGRWGLDRARQVAPYSETLSRAAMRLAAAEGDADRLRSEWHACQRMVDALDPGSYPSRRTEALYGELTRDVAVSRRVGSSVTNASALE